MTEVMQQENIENQSTMDKTALREFATSARKMLKDRIEVQAHQIGFYEDNREVQYEYSDEKVFKINGEEFEHKEADKLRNAIKEKGFDNVIDEVAYTWFNRFVALYYMEVNGYTDFDVISNLNNITQFVAKVSHKLNDEEKQCVIKAVQMNKEEQVLKTLILHQCNELHKQFPFLFEDLKDDTIKMLFPQGLMTTNSVLKNILALDKDSWKEVEIIGWLYQYYITEKKDEVFANLKKGKKISKEDVPAATQIFTPKWIVKYMVENSVGKLWLEAHPNNELQAKFKYYLESAEQEDDVKQKLEEIINRNIKPEEIKVLDPACGSGHILVTAFEVLYEIYKTSGYLEEEIPELILKNNLYGLDICNRAAQLAQMAVMMKAREYDKNISNKVTELNITSIQDTNWIDDRVKEVLLNGVDNKSLATQQVELLTDTYKDAKEYGSIIDVKGFDFDFWAERLTSIQNISIGLLYADVVSELQRKLPQLIKQAKIMQKEYECVIANPPYMGGKGMSSNLSEYVKKKYSMSKGDMFAVFKEVIFKKTKQNYFSATVNQHSWMFLSSYEQLREYFLKNTVFDTMAHLGSRAFEEIGGEVVQTTTYVTKKFKNLNYAGKFIKLTEYSNAQLKEDKFLELNSKDSYTCKQNDFLSIPESPIAYWASDRTRKIFKTYQKLENFATSRVGLMTGDTNRFLRFWFEVKNINIGFNISSAEESIISKLKWFPCNKGGGFKKWYGNEEYIINYQNDGYEIFELAKKDKRNCQNYPSEFKFKKCVSWSLISTTIPSFRIKENQISDISGMSFWCYSENNFNYLLGFCNSKIAYKFLNLINPTLNFPPGAIAILPVILDESNKTNIEFLVKSNIQISKDDWDSFETSWDFEIHPLLRFKENGKISDSFSKWKNYKQEQFNKLKANEEELNRLFIEIYGLQDEMTPEVADKDITVALADEVREIKSLMSYAVGCMFGRYSLDETGLAYAGGEFDTSKYTSLEADDDGIKPILSASWFDDDVVDEFKKFLKAAFGEQYLQENLEYIAKVLGRKGSESAEERIRKYYLNDFYKDHLQTYKKRPIYWMFTSGKEKAFNCLVYLHRYDKATLATMRTKYLHKYQAKLDTAISHAQDNGDVKLSSMYEKYREELLKFDEKLKVYADEQIDLDLDDGVKVNYAKFKGILDSEQIVLGKEKK